MVYHLNHSHLFQVSICISYRIQHVLEILPIWCDTRLSNQPAIYSWMMDLVPYHQFSFLGSPLHGVLIKPQIIPARRPQRDPSALSQSAYPWSQLAVIQRLGRSGN
jgi:hypothetical protein